MDVYEEFAKQVVSEFARSQNEVENNEMKKTLYDVIMSKKDMYTISYLIDETNIHLVEIKKPTVNGYHLFFRDFRKADPHYPINFQEISQAWRKLDQTKKDEYCSRAYAETLRLRAEQGF